MILQNWLRKETPFASLQDLKDCNALIMGSPAYFGNMAAPLKHFIDQTTPLWLSGAMIDKPAAVFTSSSTQHGGNETVLTNMMLPLLHHGMLVSGLPYSIPQLHHSQSGGSPYGASHVDQTHDQLLSQDEITLARKLGERVANLTVQLSTG